MQCTQCSQHIMKESACKCFIKDHHENLCFRSSTVFCSLPGEGSFLGRTFWEPFCVPILTPRYLFSLHNQIHVFRCGSSHSKDLSCELPEAAEPQTEQCWREWGQIAAFSTVKLLAVIVEHPGFVSHCSFSIPKRVFHGNCSAGFGQTPGNRLDAGADSRWLLAWYSPGPGILKF